MGSPRDAANRARHSPAPFNHGHPATFPPRRHRGCARSRISIILALAVAVTACQRTPESKEAAPSDGLNVVFIILDAAGAKYLGCYGNELPTTPQVDKFARTATVFERAYSQSAWTLPSVGSFMTGGYPPAKQLTIRLEGETLATTLAQNGLRTAAFSENPYVSERLGIAAGFDTFNEYRPPRYDHTPYDFGRVDSQRTVDDAVNWLDQDQEKRFFLYIHFLKPHAPYDPPPPFGGKFDPNYDGTVDGNVVALLAFNKENTPLAERDLEHLRLQYQENLAYVDHQTGRLLDALAARDLLDRTLVIVAADHGEAFREHGVLLHNTTVYEEMIHVPLIIKFPRSSWTPPSRYDGVVELRSLFPTICDVLQISNCPTSLPDGLVQRLRTGETKSGLARSWATGVGGVAPTALITERYKLIANSRTLEPLELFDLEKDPGETKDVSASHPKLLEDAAALVRNTNIEVFATGEVQLDTETRERLRALGYEE